MAEHTATKSGGPSDTKNDTPAVLDDALRREIELRAYHRHCHRGSGPGSDVENWLGAQKEVLEERQRNARRDTLASADLVRRSGDGPH